MNRLTVVLLASFLWNAASRAQQPDVQPFRAQVNRIEQALESIGQPLPADIVRRLHKASNDSNPVNAIQQVLDPLCLVLIDVNAESRVKIRAGEAPKELVQNGWTALLVKVTNVAGVTAKLRVTSPNSVPPQARSTGAPTAGNKISQAEVDNRWLITRMYDSRPMTANLSGLGIEYRILQPPFLKAGIIRGAFSARPS